MARRKRNAVALDDEPQWYRDAIIYEVHVRAFHDSDGDGIGDFRGLTEKLDYLEDLGVTAVWLLPFYPSPLRDDGYDIADYTDVHPDYGTLRDFRAFLDEAHRRGIRVITELVLNHTSDQHAWFRRARRDGAPRRWRDYYVWSDTAERYQDARIIFQDFEPSNWTWDREARSYFWHRFYSHQPDLNFDNPQVRREMLKVLDFWLKMGVDGLRLDAVPYLYEREGTNCENLDETHAYLRDLRVHVDQEFSGRMLLAEANQWPEDAVAYFGAGDECHMAFHFPLMPRLFMAVHMEDRFPIIDILQQTPEIPATCQWGVFLRNHDELTLEMVTDEERDYMVRVYATDPHARINLGIRRRLAPLLDNDRRKIELLNGFLFSLPGTPILYYGDEIGMGDNFYLGDRDGVRTPMQWSPDRNAGFSRSNPQRLYLPPVVDPEYHYEAVNVEAQRNNLSSLFWWMKRMIALRKQYRAFSRGSLEFLAPDNAKVLAYVRELDGERILVVANLSRFAQHVELELSTWAGSVPVELFGQTPFPRVAESPYALSLGPHSFYWFLLSTADEGAEEASETGRERRLPSLSVYGHWQDVLEEPARERMLRAVAGFLPLQRWFGSKTQKVRSVSLRDVVPVPPAVVALVDVEYHEGEVETYLLPLAFAGGDRAERVSVEHPRAVVARLRCGDEDGILFDAVFDADWRAALLTVVARRRRLRGDSGSVVIARTEGFRHVGGGGSDQDSWVLQSEQSNTSIVYGHALIVKLLRRLYPGVNPDLEIGRVLTARRFASTPALVGGLEYRRAREEPLVLGIAQEYVANQGDAWHYSRDDLVRYFERVAALPAAERGSPPPAPHPLDLLDDEPDELTSRLLGSFIETSRLLGVRTAEMHVALTAPTDDADFATEPFSALYQRSLFQSMRTLAGRSLTLLRAQRRRLPDRARGPAEEVLSRDREIDERLRAITGKKITARRGRTHGDYHLGQVLWTGKDFVIIDFEGEPARPVSERRIKRSPLRDVAGMMRSFHYAAFSVLYELRDRGLAPASDRLALEPWVAFWYAHASAAFLRGYLEAAEGGGFLPATGSELQRLLDAYLLEKAVYELGYELNNRPDWVEIPLRGILSLTGGADD